MEKILDEIISMERGTSAPTDATSTNAGGQNKTQKTIQLCVKALRYLCVLALIAVLRGVFNHFVQSGEKHSDSHDSHEHHHRRHHQRPYGWWHHDNPYLQADPKIGSIRQNGYQIQPIL